MSSTTLSNGETTLEVADGLIMRRGTPEDREPLASFHANTLLDVGDIQKDESMYVWMLDLMSGAHPTIKPGDFCLVEDVARKKIVSSVGLFSQTWTYEGVSFPFGQPEIVSTDPEYRRRGLVRAQFNEVHRWSAERGELVQGITGIPWYYRQFGYEMALNLAGERIGSRHTVPRLKDGEEEQFKFRRATVEDSPLFLDLYGQETARSVIASVRSEADWRYELAGRSEGSGFRAEHSVIENTSGEPVGVLVHSRRLKSPTARVYMYELRNGVSMLTVTPSVLRYVDALGRALAERDGKEYGAIAFHMGEEHPVYGTLGQSLPHVVRPYAWYIRVPDLTAFVGHIAPALEQRLAESAHAGFTGEMKLNFYRSGLRFNFSSGKLHVESWKADRVEEGDAAFPDLTFLQILFGFRSFDDLQYAFPDCSANTDIGRALVSVLFPKKSSHVWAGG